MPQEKMTQDEIDALINNHFSLEEFEDPALKLTYTINQEEAKYKYNDVDL